MNCQYFDIYSKIKKHSISDYDLFFCNCKKDIEDIYKTNYTISQKFPTYQWNDQHLDLSADRFRVIYNSWIFDILLTKSNNKKLVVIFSGARSPKEKEVRFKRWSYFPFISANVLSIIDPMYHRHPTLQLGWYYGTRDENILAMTATIIQKIKNQLHISEKDIIFAGSSGGGYAALEISKYFTQTTHIAINPQININKYTYSKSFTKITGINLEENDHFNRNKTEDTLLSNSTCRFIFVQNITDRHHCKEHLFPLLRKKGIENLSIGLTVYDNFTIWIYDAIGGHNAQGDQLIFSFILLLEKYDKFDPEILYFLYKNISLQWRQKSVIEQKLLAHTNLSLIDQHCQNYALKDWILLLARNCSDFISLEAIFNNALQYLAKKDIRLDLAAFRAYLKIIAKNGIPITTNILLLLYRNIFIFINRLPHKWTLFLLKKFTEKHTNNCLLQFIYYYQSAIHNKLDFNAVRIIKNYILQYPILNGLASLILLKANYYREAYQTLQKASSCLEGIPAATLPALGIFLLQTNQRELFETLLSFWREHSNISSVGLPLIEHWNYLQLHHKMIPGIPSVRSGKLRLTLYDIPVVFDNIPEARLYLDPIFPSFFAEAREANKNIWLQAMHAARICCRNEIISVCAWEMFKARLLSPKIIYDLEQEGFGSAIQGIKDTLAHLTQLSNAQQR